MFAVFLVFRVLLVLRCPWPVSSVSPGTLIFLDVLVPLVSVTLVSLLPSSSWVSSVSVSVLNSPLLSVAAALLRHAIAGALFLFGSRVVTVFPSLDLPHTSVIPAPAGVTGVLTHETSADDDLASDLECRLVSGPQKPTNFPSSASHADGLAYGVVFVVEILGEGSIPRYSSSPLYWSVLRPEACYL